MYAAESAPAASHNTAKKPFRPPALIALLEYNAQDDLTEDNELNKDLRCMRVEVEVEDKPGGS